MKRVIVLCLVVAVALVAVVTTALAQGGGSKGEHTAPMYILCQLPGNQAQADVAKMNAARASGHPLTPQQIDAFCK